jgi:hypothetical protein
MYKKDYQADEPRTQKRCGHGWCSDCRKKSRSKGRKPSNASNRRNRHSARSHLKREVKRWT